MDKLKKIQKTKNYVILTIFFVELILLFVYFFTKKIVKISQSYYSFSIVASILILTIIEFILIFVYFNNKLIKNVEEIDASKLSVSSEFSYSKENLDISNMIKHKKRYIKLQNWANFCGISVLIFIFAGFDQIILALDNITEISIILLATHELTSLILTCFGIFFGIKLWISYRKLKKLLS